MLLKARNVFTLKFQHSLLLCYALSYLHLGRGNDRLSDAGKRVQKSVKVRGATN